MSFNLKIIITGICAFVENDNGEGPVCVVMPSLSGRKASDDEPLCPHYSYIEQGTGSSAIQTPLERQRVWLVLEEDDIFDNRDIVSVQAENGSYHCWPVKHG